MKKKITIRKDRSSGQWTARVCQVNSLGEQYLVSRAVGPSFVRLVEFLAASYECEGGAE
ncbi:MULTISPECIES: hypothetical protein [Gordonia]|uniref:Uncharacterized protein n=1 Tax=Gordonia sihwensis NBRC 108236 TaxID=1223544 RepID=L7LEZ8_9ACTN|nr:hypothetical protein [Gordonia sihwensis]WFN93453.1 hypothetical protein P5P27_02445 [Gordonia sihwensis]GAC59321.1 hypothetical protein GSI01S_01_02870 [Gordonia sihwensis NBRC 108236]